MVINLGLAGISVGGSIALTGTTLTLVNDSVAPGNDYFYGTGPTGTKGWFALSTEGVNSITGTAGQVVASASTGAVTLSLAAALVSINSVTSTAGQPLVLATGSSGTAISIASATNIVTFSAGIVGTTATLNTITSVAGQPLALATGTTGTAISVASATNIATFALATEATASTASVILTGGLLVQKALFVNSTTASTTTGTGSIVTAGGLGVGGAAYVGGLLSVASTINTLTINATTGAITLGSASSITAASATDLTLAAGSSGASLVLGQGANGVGTLSGGAQSTTAILSLSNSVAASDFVGIILGTSTSSINSSSRRWQIASNYQNNGVLDIMRSTTSTGAATTSVAQFTSTGNLLIGGTTDITGSGGLKVFGTTAATSTTTGAFQCAGGVGIAGSIYAGGTITGSQLTLIANRIEEFVSNATTAVALNYAGYLGGTTQFRNLDVYDGKNAIVFSLDGPTKAATLAGDLTVSGGNVGVGTAAATDKALYIAGTLTSGTDQYGLLNLQTFSTAATSSGTAADFRVETANGVFVMTTARGINVRTPSIGASSAITTNTGLNITNQGAAGITNAYGIDIAAQSGAATTNVGLRNAGSTLLTNATASTSTATGALIVSGGVGVAGNIVSGGGQGWGVTSTATAAGTTTLASDSRVVQVFTGSSTQTAQLPAASLFGANIAVVYVIKNRSSGNVTVNRAVSDTIDGATTYVLTGGLNQSVTLVSNGVDAWSVI